MIRDHGQAQKYYHDVEGYNGRLDAIQAGMLRIKLRHLDDWNARRRAAAAKYGRLLEESRIQNPESRSDQSILNSEFGILNSSVIVPHEPDNCRAIYHLYVIRHPDRDALMQHLKDQQIFTALHYPVPIHLQKAYAELGYKEGDFPVTEKSLQGNHQPPHVPGSDGDSDRTGSGRHSGIHNRAIDLTAQGL